MRFIASDVVVIALLLGTHCANAHESRPLYVQVVERAPKTFTVMWKIPPSALSVTSPQVVMPDSCRPSA